MGEESYIYWVDSEDDLAQAAGDLGLDFDDVVFIEHEDDLNDSHRPENFEGVLFVKRGLGAALQDYGWDNWEE